MYPTDAERFLAQNEIAAATLTLDDIEGWAEHHAGGLMVLMFNNLPDGRVVKLHDSWGDPEDAVVVHTYDPDKPDDEDETIAYFMTGRVAFDHFLSLTSGAGRNLTPDQIELREALADDLERVYSAMVRLFATYDDAEDAVTILSLDEYPFEQSVEDQMATIAACIERIRERNGR